MKLLNNFILPGCVFDRLFLTYTSLFSYKGIFWIDFGIIGIELHVRITGLKKYYFLIIPGVESCSRASARTRMYLCIECRGRWFFLCCLRVRKKLKNQKKIKKKPNREKKPIKPTKILKKPTGSDWFRFYKPKTEKNKLNPNWARPEKKPSQTENTEPNGKTKPNRFEPVLVF